MVYQRDLQINIQHSYLIQIFSKQFQILLSNINIILCLHTVTWFTQSARAVKYTDCTSAEELPATSHKCPGYDTKQSHGEAPVMLELWGMQSTPSLPLLPGLLWPRVVAPDRVLSMGQIELNCILMLNWIVWNGTVFVCETELLEIEPFWHFTVLKQFSLV